MTEFEILNYKVSRLELYLAISGDRDSVAWGYQELADMRDFQWSLMEQECPGATPAMLLDGILDAAPAVNVMASGSDDESWDT